MNFNIGQVNKYVDVGKTFVIASYVTIENNSQKSPHK